MMPVAFLCVSWQKKRSRLRQNPLNVIVKQFDTEQGKYHFELSDFVTEFHSHPTIEVLLATKGTFSIKSKAKEWEDIHLSAKADSGISSTEINHAVGEDAILIFIGLGLVLQEYQTTPISQLSR